MVGLLWREHGGRLIENEQLRVLHQRAHDLDTLTFPDRKPPDFPARFERKPIAAGDLGDAGGHLGKGFLRWQPQRDVLRDGEILEQREMLKHHADAQRPRLRGSGERRLAAEPVQLAVVGLNESVSDLHEGRFAGTILAQQGVNLRRMQVEVDVVVGDEGAVELGDADGLQKRFRRRLRLIKHDACCSSAEPARCHSPPTAQRHVRAR